MTVFVQQLGRGLRLHEGEQRLTVLDFIGNYRRAQYKLPFLTGIEDDSPEEITKALRVLSADQRLSISITQVTGSRPLSLQPTRVRQ